MMKKPVLKTLVGLTALAAAFVAVFLWHPFGDEGSVQRDKPYFRHILKKEEPKRLDSPGKFAQYHRAIRTKYGEEAPAYQPNFAVREYEKAMKLSALSSARTDESAWYSRWQSRGPFNVGGRTRTILPLPDDPVNHWLAGATGGGIWETTDAGKTWTLRTPDFPSLSITSLDYCEKYPNVIYAGTGEAIGLDVTFSAGVFVSRNGGRTWRQLKQTINFDEPAINRVVADPQDPDVFLYCASSSISPRGRRVSSSIYKASRRGYRIDKVYESSVSDSLPNKPERIGVAQLTGFVQQIVHDPTDFNVLYASVNATGVLRSTDRGETWELFDRGLGQVNGRLELAVASTDPARLYASAESDALNTGSALYVSTDSAQSWAVVESSEDNGIDFLGGQGWYDNTAMVNPFNENDVYFGGVNLWRYQIQDSIPVAQDTIATFEVGVSQGAIIVLENFLGNRAEGVLTLGNVPEDSLSDVEIRFGAEAQQMAHRFTTNGANFNSPDSTYLYQDYVPVPFEVWDVTNDRQLMVSFRDQQEDSVFNLLNLNEAAAFEYIFVHNIAYADTPGASIAQDGSPTTGPFAQLLYSVWPTLQPGAEWEPDNLAEQTIVITRSGSREVRSQSGVLTNVSDAYLQYSGTNSFFGNIDQVPEAFHPDHHELVPVDLNPQTKEFRIINGNDGGVFISNRGTDPGVNDGDWSYRSYGYVTGQFYGADKAPGEDRYVGGLQDQGSWASPAGQDADSETNYDFVFGGDGFEVLWNSADINKILVTSQGGNIGRSTDGGQTFTTSTGGIEGQGPFVTRLANANANPGTVFTVTNVGVARSTDFGGSWTTVPITEGWGLVGALPSASVEVSLANPDIVWAGQGMTPDLNFQVSTDRGLTYQAVSNYEGERLGLASGFATHPYEPNTAFALFSFAASPKVLKTTDLGETWTDISGFAGEDSSATGFPDVAVYSLLVRPDRPNVIWAGTEIGIYESRDEGRHWRALRNFPNVPVWQMKVVDDQVVVATHGRGIFTTELRRVPPTTILPQLIAAGTAPNGGLAVEVDIDSEFDSAYLVIDGEQVAGLSPLVGQQIYSFDEIRASATVDTLQVKVRAYLEGRPLTSSALEAVLLPVKEAVTTYVEDFNNGSDDFLGDFQVETLPGFADGAIHSEHPYGILGDFTYLLQRPIIVANQEATLRYRDIALIEPGEEGAVFGDGFFYDFVVVEGTKDGLSWVPLDSGYDATRDEAWLNAYVAGVEADSSLFRPQRIDLQGAFSAEDTILVRFRLSSDPAAVGYGWVIDDLAIQAQEVQASRHTQSRASALLSQTTDVYPNPTTGPIEFSQEIDGVQIYSLDGRFIRNEAVSRHMDLSDLRAGTYLLRIEKEGVTTTKRILIQD